MGLRPLLGPPCIPRSTPKENFQIPQNGEGTRLELRELPSLAALVQVISLRAALMPEYTFALDDFPFQLDNISDCDVAVFSLNLTIIGTWRSRLALSPVCKVFSAGQGKRRRYVAEVTKAG